MYNEIIANRLNNLKYLAPLKKSNVSIISKANKYGDVVKFFAQINENNIIQKITFKATGCSALLSLCDYFCEIITGKNIDDANNLTYNDLSEFASLDQSKEHVYEIILDTFKLLIKKYKKGVEKNKIIPISAIVDNSEVKSDIKQIIKKDNVINHSELDEILVKEDAKKAAQKPSKKKVDIIVKPKADETVVINLQTVEEIKVEETELMTKEVVVSEPEVVVAEELIIDTPNNVAEDNHNIVEVKQEIPVVETITESKQDKTIIEEKKTSHLMALRQKISNKENNEKAQNHVNSLSSMISLMNRNRQMSEEINSTKNEEKVDVVNEKSNETKKEKKSLFSWFKKK